MQEKAVMMMLLEKNIPDIVVVVDVTDFVRLLVCWPSWCLFIVDDILHCC